MGGSDVYAEEADNWRTTVTIAKSQAETLDLLDVCSATEIQSTIGQANGRAALVVHFELDSRTFRFGCQTLAYRDADLLRSFEGKHRSRSEQAEYPMGRIAGDFAKAPLTAAQAQPDALCRFIEIPGTEQDGALSATIAELDLSGLMSTLPSLPEVAERHTHRAIHVTTEVQ